MFTCNVQHDLQKGLRIDEVGKDKHKWQMMRWSHIGQFFMMCKLYIAPFVNGIINLGRSLLSLPITFALNSVVLNNPFTAICLIYVVGVNTSLSLWYGNQMPRNFFMRLMYITCMCFVVRPEWPAEYRDVLKLINHPLHCLVVQILTKKCQHVPIKPFKYHWLLCCGIYFLVYKF